MRFLHTADWQIGMPARHARTRAQAISAERPRTVKRIVDLANEQRVDFMLVAGDQFEDAAPNLSEIAQVVAALKSAIMPVYVLPGNHDPARGDSPYASPAWRALADSKVVTVLDPTTFEVPGGVLLASPCQKKYSIQDPTTIFQELPSADGAIRIGCAHGTLAIGFAQEFDDGNQRGGYPIALNAASRAGLSYVALGHWHSYFESKDGDALIAYSGTPEPTSFADRDCGTVSIVEINGPRAVPKVERMRVAGLTWHDPSFTIVKDVDFHSAVSELERIPDPERAVIKATFRGFLAPSLVETRAIAQATLLPRFFSYNEVDELAVARENTLDWRSAMPTGLAAEVADRLFTELEGENAAVATRALVMLREIAQ